MPGYCSNIPEECQAAGNIIWVFLMISFFVNISQCLYSNNLRRRYKVLKERLPILNSLLEEIVIESDIPEATTMEEVPEATIVHED